MEEGPLQRLGEAGMKGLAWHGHQGAPPAENLQGGLVSKNLPHERTGVDSIAVPLFTNSGTAAATPLGLMRNFQWTIIQ